MYVLELRMIVLKHGVSSSFNYGLVGNSALLNGIPRVHDPLDNISIRTVC